MGATHRVARRRLVYRGTRQYTGRHRRGGPNGTLCRRIAMPHPGRPALLTPDGRGRILADGTVMPLLGLGVWQVPDEPTCVHGVRSALELGYRHIDTAQAYG